MDNQQVVMLRKLIVLSIVANGSNSDLNRFMNSTKKVPFNVKANILKIIYVEDIKQVYFMYLDLLIPFRYLIKEKILEYLNTLKSNKINIQDELKNLSSFSEKEVVFYEALHRVENRINAYEMSTQSNPSAPLSSQNSRTLPQTCLTNRVLELCILDALATYVVLDVYILCITTHKVTIKILDSLRNNADFKNKVEENMKNILDEHDVDQTAIKLIDLLTTYLLDLKIQPEKITKHIKSYLKIVNPESGICFQCCYRYSYEKNVGVKICATKKWHRNAVIHELNGNKINLNDQELQYLTENRLDFSIIKNSSNNKMQIWLGPASFVNNDCNSNTRFNCLKSKKTVCFEIISEVDCGDEITCSYGENCFSDDECECITCEKNESILTK
ncbi:histone-lysine N-methyltransferase KMT5C isoform X1 [Nasonia vitripennis]|uniref:SET domain-containing protein n=1 Tax=Nasonia vitripennis TaxID=7425 RepID=A0A7M7R246_NASVI|nr:histone-lysine N-methyltransferase KMT5C isoform X1 [Nasonia vitripennis]XP_031786676.1 histone-lysine N-methyltransferase KMT5C isoform X1 [Nasonia vitripennis]XP_031786695.1 histone-lysine N-methyltransferase KMT5C isoform X1 [Nasonia vitripennis]XP_031786722.1 histone-lysine N-methyltransferase KMT5C isoform X1 [Nasonia vitripennis]XP_031786729.1 histone-lysine N-methyltransferase KMT5C isoform X1 [Nasonia vitripennis]XP_032457145.1 histone-lysine N-methyltransferase KMT5C isoform X1 [Na